MMTSFLPVEASLDVRSADVVRGGGANMGIDREQAAAFATAAGNSATPSVV